MPTPIRQQLADLCRAARADLDVTQDELARAVGISRGYLAAIEIGRANATLEVASRIGAVLGLDLRLVGRRQVVVAPRQVDFVHARCSAAVQRRLRAAGFECEREVALIEGEARGWADLLAFHQGSGLLIVIEIKTTLAEIGGAERQLGWYERLAPSLARSRGWQVRRAAAWLLVLETDEVDRAIRDNRDSLALAFPSRARAMRDVLGLAGADSPGPDSPGATGALGPARRGLALIDPTSRRRTWLQPSRVDGRKRSAAFRDYADAATRLRGSRS